MFWRSGNDLPGIVANTKIRRVIAYLTGQLSLGFLTLSAVEQYAVVGARYALTRIVRRSETLKTAKYFGGGVRVAAIDNMSHSQAAILRHSPVLRCIPCGAVGFVLQTLREA